MSRCAEVQRYCLNDLGEMTAQYGIGPGFDLFCFEDDTESFGAIIRGNSLTI
jgi:hypothetical protein